MSGVGRDVGPGVSTDPRRRWVVVGNVLRPGWDLLTLLDTVLPSPVYVQKRRGGLVRSRHRRLICLLVLTLEIRVVGVGVLRVRRLYPSVRSSVGETPP